MLVFRYFIGRLAWWGSVIIPLACATIWTTWPTLQAASATLRASPVEIAEADWQTDVPLLAQRRFLQQTLLEHGLYIPLSDIVPGVPEVKSGIEASELSLFMQKTCGPSTLYVWIPLRFRLPLLGEHVWEWCWKPPVTKI